MNKRLLSALCFVMLAANTMGEEPVTFPDVEWEVRTPAEVGLDVAKLHSSACRWGAGWHGLCQSFGILGSRIIRSNPLMRTGALPVFKIARVLVRFDHVVRVIVNANHGIM